jgi:hypothetical protein
MSARLRRHTLCEIRTILSGSLRGDRRAIRERPAAPGLGDVAEQARSGSTSMRPADNGGR